MGALILGALWGSVFLQADESFPATRDDTVMAVGDQAYLDLDVFWGCYGLAAEWITPGKRPSFTCAWTQIEMEVDSREISYNGQRVFMGSEVIATETGWAIDRIDAEKVLAPLLSPSIYRATAREVKTIVLDAGHGGKDGGTANAGRKLKEKTFTIDVVKRIGGILSQQGYNVVYTRRDDTYLSLAERALVGKEAGADFFVSRHFNAAGKKTVKGVGDLCDDALASAIHLQSRSALE
ncbi:MAG: N-acetylmuramoyl-L-alanine amidase [Candidatus Synoicihabitans palmerolidicus]|nr:N-acetylmuramoyl-L-alanine amidase [Candidatus Synoicihabitans palmerolidicus]